MKETKEKEYKKEIRKKGRMNGKEIIQVSKNRKIKVEKNGKE